MKPPPAASTVPTGTVGAASEAISTRSKSRGIVPPADVLPSQVTRTTARSTDATGVDGTAGGVTSSATVTVATADHRPGVVVKRPLARTLTWRTAPTRTGEMTAWDASTDCTTDHGAPTMFSRTATSYPATSSAVPSDAVATSPQSTSSRPRAAPSVSMNASLSTTSPSGAAGVRLSGPCGAGRAPEPPSACDPPTIPDMRRERRISASSTRSLSTRDPPTPSAPRVNVTCWTRTRSDA